MDIADYETWANTLISHHKNPLIKVELKGSKFFFSTNSDTEIEAVKDALHSITKLVYNERVERRCGRAVANWLTDSKQAEIEKECGLINTFGITNRNGKFLFPEEVLYLLETNRLELFWNGLPVSIKQAYAILLNSCMLEKYMVYKKLLLAGFHLYKDVQLQKYETVAEPSIKKARLESCDDCSSRSVKTDSSNNVIRKIFDKLKQEGPKQFIPTSGMLDFKEDYKLFLPKTKIKTEANFNIFVWNDKDFDPKLAFLNGSIPSVIGYTSSEFAGFFSVASVNLPDLT